LQGEARVDGVDAYGDFTDAGGAGAGQDGEDVLPGFGFFCWGYRVFEVVGEGVDGGDEEGFLEEAEGGTGDWE
jgi:hypothetical protein